MKMFVFFSTNQLHCIQPMATSCKWLVAPVFSLKTSGFPNPRNTSRLRGALKALRRRVDRRFSYFDWRPFVIGVFLTAPTTSDHQKANSSTRWVSAKMIDSMCGREFECNDFTVSFPGLDCPSFSVHGSFVVHSLSQQFSFLASSTSLFLQPISCPAGNWLATSRNWSPAGPLMQLGSDSLSHGRKGRWTLYIMLMWVSQPYINTCPTWTYCIGVDMAY